VRARGRRRGIQFDAAERSPEERVEVSRISALGAAEGSGHGVEPVRDGNDVDVARMVSSAWRAFSRSRSRQTRRLSSEKETVRRALPRWVMWWGVSRLHSGEASEAMVGDVGRSSQGGGVCESPRGGATTFEGPWSIRVIRSV
jgi:hypothetical protein